MSPFVLMALHPLPLMLCLFVPINSEQLYFGHKVIRVIPETKKHLNVLSSLRRQFNDDDVEFWTLPLREGAAVDIRVSPTDAYNNISQMLASSDIKFKVQIPDLQSAIEGQDDMPNMRRELLSWFEKYHPLDEIISRLRKTTNDCKGRCHLFTLGKSYEGRQLYAVEIHANHDVSKPLIFINCGIHAREWVSPATCMYFINQLVPRYSDDVTVREMLNKVDFVILPVLNVDGYVYTWQKDRMWRKNRSLNPGSECVGTDLNRNWGFQWGGFCSRHHLFNMTYSIYRLAGHDDQFWQMGSTLSLYSLETGASSHPCSPAYHGRTAMSEEEVQSVANFLESQQHRLVGYLDIHSYSQMILFPWGYTKEPTEDQEELKHVAKAMAHAIKSQGGYHTNYTFGQASHVIYIESGTTKDYVYGHLNVKYTFSMELRDTGKYGFLLPSRLIEPTAKEAFEGIKAMALNIKLND